MGTKLFLLVTIVNIVYVTLGGLVFHILESKYEKNEIEANKQSLLKIACLLNNSSYPDSIRAVVKDFEKHLRTVPRWDYVGAFSFACTTITTIGFGHASPSTRAGQIWCIFYALLGIPLNILTLNILLEKICTGCTKLYSRIKRSNVPRENISEERVLDKIAFFVVLMVLPFVLCAAGLFSYVERWTYFEGLYFAVIAFTSVGLGDLAPSKHNTQMNHDSFYRISSCLLVFVGLALTYALMNIFASFYKNLLSTLADKLPNNNRVSDEEILEERREKKTREMSATSLFSFDENAYIGSFAAVKRAIDKIKQRKGCSSEYTDHQLNTLKTIEDVLLSEYLKVKRNRGNLPKARWRRAITKVCQNHRFCNRVQLESHMEEGRTTVQNETIITTSVTYK